MSSYPIVTGSVVITLGLWSESFRNMVSQLCYSSVCLSNASLPLDQTNNLAPPLLLGPPRHALPPQHEPRRNASPSRSLQRPLTSRLLRPRPLQRKSRNRPLRSLAPISSQRFDCRRLRSKHKPLLRPLLLPNQTSR